MQNLIVWISTVSKKQLCSIVAAVAAALVVVGGTFYYHNSTRQTQQIAKPIVESRQQEISQPSQNKATTASVEPTESKTNSSSVPAPSQTGTPPKSVSPKQAPAPTPPAPTVAMISVGGLIAGPASSGGGACSVPANTTIKTNFSGSVTLNFTARNVNTGQRDAFSKYVTVSPGVVVSVQQSMSFITPGTYPIEVTLSVGSSSFSSAYTGPSVSYSGSTTSTVTCENY